MHFLETWHPELDHSSSKPINGSPKFFGIVVQDASVPEEVINLLCPTFPLVSLLVRSFASRCIAFDIETDDDCKQDCDGYKKY